MWRVFNWLFGWDYIYWENSCDNGVARVHKSPDNTVWFWRYKITRVIDIINIDGKTYPWLPPVVWLTCSKDKYLTVYQKFHGNLDFYNDQRYREANKLFYQCLEKLKECGMNHTQACDWIKAWGGRDL